MRCRLCGTEARRNREGEGHKVECPRCGEYWIGLLLVREVLRPHAEHLAVAVQSLNAAGGTRIALRSADDIERVLADAKGLDLISNPA